MQNAQSGNRWGVRFLSGSRSGPFALDQNQPVAHQHESGLLLAHTGLRRAEAGQEEIGKAQAISQHCLCGILHQLGEPVRSTSMGWLIPAGGMAGGRFRRRYDLTGTPSSTPALLPELCANRGCHNPLSANHQIITKHTVLQVGRDVGVIRGGGKKIGRAVIIQLVQIAGDEQPVLVRSQLAYVVGAISVAVIRVDLGVTNSSAHKDSAMGAMASQLTLAARKCHGLQWESPATDQRRSIAAK